MGGTIEEVAHVLTGLLAGESVTTCTAGELAACVVSKLVADCTMGLLVNAVYGWGRLLGRLGRAIDPAEVAGYKVLLLWC